MDICENPVLQFWFDFAHSFIRFSVILEVLTIETNLKKLFWKKDLIRNLKKSRDIIKVFYEYTNNP